MAAAEKEMGDQADFDAEISESYDQRETILERIDNKLKERKELHEARPLGRWELANKKFSLVYDKGTYILVTQGTGKEQKLKAKTRDWARQELVKKGYRES